ncbi:hypothetical protein PRNP1_009483 [Phytophthora ramorum]
MSKRNSKKSANAASLSLVLKALDKYDQEDTSSTQSAFGSLLGTVGKAPSKKEPPPRIQPLNYPVQSGATGSKTAKQPPRVSRRAPPKATKKAAQGTLGGAALAEWLESQVPRDGLGHPAIAASYAGSSSDADPYACIAGNFLPLWCFLDVEDAGTLGQPPELAQQLPMKAVGLPLDDITGVTGSWSSCMVTAFDASLDRFIVSWSAGKRVGSPVMHRGLLCIEKDDCEAFVQRIQRAVQRREQAEAALRQSLYVESMPISSDTQLDSHTISNILQLTLSSSSVPTNIGTSALLEEVNADYMYTMNKLIFETNVDDMENEFSDLKLPKVSAPPPPPQCGVISLPAYDYNRRFLDIATDKFVNLPFAVNALLDVRRSCVDVGTQKLLLEQQPTEISFGSGARPQPKSITLAEFHSLHTQMSHTALRSMRDCWTRLAAKRIQLHFSQAQHLQYNPAEPNRQKYLEMPLRRFLQRVNYMIEDTLRLLIQQNFEGYAQFVEEMAGYHVEIPSTNWILLTTPSRHISRSFG